MFATRVSMVTPARSAWSCPEAPTRRSSSASWPPACDYEINAGTPGMWMDRSWSLDNVVAIDPVHGDDEGAPTGYTQYYDPMTGVMVALSRSPGAATDLFNNGFAEHGADRGRRRRRQRLPPVRRDCCTDR